jgi:hypothetical protein
MTKSAPVKEAQSQNPNTLNSIENLAVIKNLKKKY